MIKKNHQTRFCHWLPPVGKIYLLLQKNNRKANKNLYKVREAAVPIERFFLQSCPGDSCKTLDFPQSLSGVVTMIKK